MPLPKRILEIQKELNEWRSQMLDHSDAINKAMFFGIREPRPTPRQITLSRLLGRPPEDFIP
jgi:hypothetical protein